MRKRRRDPKGKGLPLSVLRYEFGNCAISRSRDALTFRSRDPESGSDLKADVCCLKTLCICAHHTCESNMQQRMAWNQILTINKRRAWSMRDCSLRSKVCVRKVGLAKAGPLRRSRYRDTHEASREEESDTTEIPPMRKPKLPLPCLVDRTPSSRSFQQTHDRTTSRI